MSLPSDTSQKKLVLSHDIKENINLFLSSPFRFGCVCENLIFFLFPDKYVLLLLLLVLLFF